MRAFLSLSLFLLGNFIVAENPCGFMFPHIEGMWGRSALWVESGASVNLYRSPHGEKAGLISRTVEGNLNFNLNNNSSKKLIQQNDLVWIGHYDNSLLRIVEEKDGYYKILPETVDEGLWINALEIDKEKLQIFSFKELLFEESSKLPEKLIQARATASVGVNLVNSCLRLRNSPSLNGEQMDCIAANNYKDWKLMTHLKILQVDGDWAYVKVITEKHVTVDDGPDDCSYEIFHEQMGWVKAIDGNGYPNIWFSVTNY